MDKEGGNYTVLAACVAACVHCPKSADCFNRAAGGCRGPVCFNSAGGILADCGNDADKNSGGFLCALAAGFILGGIILAL